MRSCTIKEVKSEKNLSEMTIKELWMLFPIIIKEHNPNYKLWYETENYNLINCFRALEVNRINHIGSSAVPGLVSKPTVDILLELNNNCNIQQVICQLKSLGWILMSSNYKPDIKISFNKGYTPSGFAEKVYHLHVRYVQDSGELYFRDYLIDHPDIANEYGQLKLSLQKNMNMTEMDIQKQNPTL